MKKLFMFLCCIVMVAPAWALNNNCVNKNKQNCWGANEYLNINGVNGCFECDDNDCQANTVIIAKDAGIGYSDSQGTEINRGWHVYTCYLSNGFMGVNRGDQWRRTEAGLCDKDDPLKDDPNAEQFPDMTQGRQINDSSKAVIGVINGKACLVYKCKSNYKQVGNMCKPLNSKCVSRQGNLFVDGDTTKIECDKNASTIAGSLAAGGALTSLDHVIKGDSTKCTATCKADGWDITLNSNDSCQGNDYVMDGAQKKCVKSDDAIRRDNRNAALRAQEECTKSGGEWANGGCVCDSEKKHLEPLVSGKTCKCLNGYVFENGNCVITNVEARKQICDRAVGEAEWNPVTNTCVCLSKDMMISFNYNTGKCEQDEEYKKCKSASNTKWNITSNRCECAKSGYEWNGTSCEKGEGLIHQEAVSTLKNKIKVLSDGVSGRIADWKSGLSVWKTSEGNFNGARLASDSIAGVVLGTAGGLITSNIVKKNQVKSGFEDVSCTVGGQRVADWADEFTVGIK